MNTVQTMPTPAPTGEQERLELRSAASAPDRPISIYQVHPGSWKRVPEEQNRPLTGPEFARELAEHVQRLNFTHVQLHSPDWADPQELKFLISCLHQRDIGVILETDQPFHRGTPANTDEFHADGRSIGGETLLSAGRYQWDMAWAEETAAYFATDPLYRKFRQSQFLHRDGYAFDENFILPLSHQLVARPRPSLYAMMPGDSWQKFANLRLLFAYQYLLPGKKLVFMGDEFGEPGPWQPESSLDWHLVSETNPHGKLMNWVANLNRCYRAESALHQTDTNPAGFQWIDCSDATSSVVSFLRRGADASERLLVVLNFTPVPRHNYRIGAPGGGNWRELLNSDALEFGGSGQGNLGSVEAAPFGWNFQSHSLMVTLPPLAGIVLKAG